MDFIFIEIIQTLPPFTPRHHDNHHLIEDSTPTKTLLPACSMLPNVSCLLPACCMLPALNVTEALSNHLPAFLKKPPLFH